MIFSMYCLDIDLVCSSVAKSKYYDILNIDSGVQDTKILLEANYKAIKKRENILKIIEDLKPRNYPESFNKIKMQLLKISMEINSSMKYFWGILLKIYL